MDRGGRHGIVEYPEILALLNSTGVFTLEDCASWSAGEPAALRGFGPKAFVNVEAAMKETEIAFDPAPTKRADPINRAMAAEGNKGAVAPTEPGNLPAIGRPATRALAAIGVQNIEQLANYTEQEILALHGVGPKAIRILRPVMEERGIAFHDEAGEPV